MCIKYQTIFCKKITKISPIRRLLKVKVKDVLFSLQSNWTVSKVALSSRKLTYIILTPLNPTLYTKTGVYRGIHYFSYFCSKHRMWVFIRTPSARQF